MLDFTCALYLGLRHPSRSLRPWPRLTLGVPAALDSPPGAEAVAQEIAALQGCERGVLGPSTFHLFWDAFGMFSRRPVAVYVDGGAYPIARWGVERAAARGVPIREFAHGDAEALRRALREDRHRRPVLLTDGFCPSCGKAAPLPAYLDSLRAFGGWLVVDDTQALGIFGHSPRPDAPYGRGGGGMLARLQVAGPNVLVISSLAKAFGAPVAALCGSKAAVEYFERNSETRMHCSPPAVAVIRAAEHALFVNRNHGDRLRRRLAALVALFRRRVSQTGLALTGGLFPVQSLAPSPHLDALRLHEQLLRRGIRTVLRRAHDGRGLRLSFVITARHTPAEFDRASRILAHSAGLPSGFFGGGHHNGFS
jgi:8-amino-7-oxononanoate synthase